MTIELGFNSIAQINLLVDQMMSPTVSHQGWIGFVRSVTEIVDRIGIGIAFTNEDQVIFDFTIRYRTRGIGLRRQSGIRRAKTPA